MNKYCILFAIIAVLGCSFNVVNANSSYNMERHSILDSRINFQKASDMFMQRDFPRAITYLDEAIRKNPDNPQLYLNRGFVKQIIQNYDGAMKDYDIAIEINPNFAFAYNNRGALKVSMNDVDGAMDDYTYALYINDNYSDVYYNRGNLKFMLDDFEGALEDFNKAIELNPNDSDAYNNRGVVKKRLELNVGALSDYTQAITLNPNDSIAYANRGRLKKLYFDNEGASVDLNQAIALAENQAFIKNVKPLVSNTEYIAAIPSVVSFAYDITEDDGDLYYKPASVNLNETPSIQNEKLAMSVTPALNLNKIAEPIKKVNMSENKPKSNNTVITNQEVSVPDLKKNNTQVIKAGVGKVTVPEKNPDIRTKVVTEKATTNVKLAESYYIRGLQKCVLRDLVGAIADLDKAIANNNKYADAYFYRAAIKKELGDKEGFRQDYATAIKINPSLQIYNDANALTLISG